MNTEVLSPFHPGEQQVQEQVGVRASAEQLGSRVVRDHLPDQHIDFYENLDYLLVGHQDSEGSPWASFLQFAPNLETAIHEHSHLTVSNSREFHIPTTSILPEDPLRQSLSRGLHLGFLGIDLSNRRRNRMAATVTDSDSDRLQLAVKQTFGNCPQYIQTRIPNRVANWSAEQVKTSRSKQLSADDQALIQASDTFFVATYYDGESDANPAAIGADVSHRGGQPGFVRIDDNRSLTIPDYSGNNHFNTLGNIAANGRAGLTFLDFATGDILMLTGKAQILWDQDASFFEGAERLWQFQVEQVLRHSHALAFHYEFDSYSPSSLVTDTWSAAETRLSITTNQQQWLPFQVVGIEPETPTITSFILKPPTQFKFSAGQYLTVCQSPDEPSSIRTYTISSAPEDRLMRISVKREPNGVISNWLHDSLRTGDILQARAPMGSFVQELTRPAVYVAAGIGITPMIAMIRERAHGAVDQASIAPMILFYQAKTKADLAFAQELNLLQQQFGARLKLITVLSQPEQQLSSGSDYNYQGRLNRSILRANLQLDNYQFFLCGPGEFIQNLYDDLRSLGVNDSEIITEAFGPSSLNRSSTDNPTPSVAVAETAEVIFTDSNTESTWSAADGTLLEFAEKQGLNPNSSCRTGKCGSCAVKLAAGKVAYPQQPDYQPDESEVLLCCAKPAANSEPIKLCL